jgi:hypothetical protein
MSEGECGDEQQIDKLSPNLLLPLFLLAAIYASRSSVVIAFHCASRLLMEERLALLLSPNCSYDCKKQGDLLVTPYIIGLGADEQKYAKNGDADENLVAGAVIRLVVISVYL